MTWEISLTRQAQAFLDGLDEDDKSAVVGTIEVLRDFGPNLGRPYADVLTSSKHSNMKELRVHRAGKEFRVLFAFDRKRKGILLTGGDKLAFPGGPDAFYRRFIPEADDLFDEHLKKIAADEANKSVAQQSKVARNPKSRKTRTKR